MLIWHHALSEKGMDTHSTNRSFILPSFNVHPLTHSFCCFCLIFAANVELWPKQEDIGQKRSRSSILPWRHYANTSSATLKSENIFDTHDTERSNKDHLCLLSVFSFPFFLWKGMEFWVAVTTGHIGAFWLLLISQRSVNSIPQFNLAPWPGCYASYLITGILQKISLCVCHISP